MDDNDRERNKINKNKTRKEMKVSQQTTNNQD